MPGPIAFAPISVCANQLGSFAMRFVPAAGVDLTGARLSCEFRTSAQPSTPVMTPTVSTEIVTDKGKHVLVGTFSWTKAQAQALLATGETFDKKTAYAVEVDLAFSDDPAGQYSMRFVSTANVSPGGNQA